MGQWLEFFKQHFSYSLDYCFCSDFILSLFCCGCFPSLLMSVIQFYGCFSLHCGSFHFMNSSFSQLSLTALSTILKQQKRKRKKVPVDIEAVAGTKPCLPSDPLAPGDRDDNKWHQYDSSALPTTKELWDSSTFVPKTHLGYYCWPA